MKQNDLEKGDIVCSKKKVIGSVFAVCFAAVCLFTVFGLLMHKMVEDMIADAIGGISMSGSNSVKYQAAVTLPPITTMLVKGRMVDPNVVISQPPLDDHLTDSSGTLVEPPIRPVETNPKYMTQLPEEFPEKASPDYSLSEYSSVPYDQEYDDSTYDSYDNGSGDYYSSSSRSLTDDENLQNGERSDSYDDTYWY